MMAQHAPVLIPVLFFLGALLTPLLAGRRPLRAFPLAVTVTGGALGLALTGLTWVLAHGTMHYKVGGWEPPIGIEMILDPLSGFVVTVILAVALMVLIHSGEVVSRELPNRIMPFFSCALLLLGGLTGIVLTGDLFNLYVFLEISSIAGYSLLAVGHRKAAFATFRYVMLGSVGASFYLLGLGFIFIKTGSLNMADVALILKDLDWSPALVTGVVLILVGLGMKMALFPLHGWLPDVYTYASSSATALISPIGTKVAAYALLRITGQVLTPEVFQETLDLADIVAWMAVGGILWGSWMAMAQTDLKRMLAYSSVGQVGYIALGIALSNPLGITGAVLHIMNHACMKACLFLVAANFIQKLGHCDLSKLDAKTARKLPWTCLAFTVAALSMIGLPPTAGFFSKWYLVRGSLEAGQVLLVIVILVSSLMNAIYFFRILERLYLSGGKETPASDPVRREDAGANLLLPTLVLASGVVLLGLASQPIVEGVIQPMLPALGQP